MYKDTPSHDIPLSWQLTHPLDVLAWIMAPVGTGVLNAVLGGTVVEFAATRAAGVLCKWQLSHLELIADGMCEVAPVGLVAGSTTMLVIP